MRDGNRFCEDRDRAFSMRGFLHVTQNGCTRSAGRRGGEVATSAADGDRFEATEVFSTAVDFPKTNRSTLI